MVWDDRAMSEKHADHDNRDAFRQIVFFTKFTGPECQYRLKEVSSLAGPVGGR
jgi:hypothetical protein